MLDVDTVFQVPGSASDPSILVAAWGSRTDGSGEEFLSHWVSFQLLATALARDYCGHLQCRWDFFFPSYLFLSDTTVFPPRDDLKNKTAGGV